MKLAQFVYLANLLTSAVACLIIYRYTIKKRIFDHPNDRSLHQTLIPKGGGLAIVFTLLFTLFGINNYGYLLHKEFIALILVILFFGYLGWIDVVSGLGEKSRLVLQFLAGGLFIYIVGPIEHIRFLNIDIPLSWLAYAFSLVWFVWLVNVFNFMDGIDGLAGIQSVITSTFLSVWFFWAGDTAFGLLCSAAAGAVMGFLIFNWSPAKMFMGDVGSLVLGAFYASVSIVGASRHGIPFTAFVLLLSIFLWDTVFTLFRRVINKENILKAHRKHLYQRAALSGLSHSTVSIVVSLGSLALGIFATLEFLDGASSIEWIIYSISILALLTASVIVVEKSAR